jgi:hypothetical protein
MRKTIVAIALGLSICTLSMVPLFIHTFGCDPYDEYLHIPQPSPSSVTDNPYPIYECWAPLPFAPVGPAFGLCWVIVWLGLFLTTRISDRLHERVAVRVGIVSTLLAALIGFSISGLDPILVLTDWDFYSCLPCIAALGVLFGKLERRRRPSSDLFA